MSRDYCEACGYTDSHDSNCPRPHPTESQGETPVRRYAVTKGFENDNGDFVKLADYRTLERALSECRRELAAKKCALDEYSRGVETVQCPNCQEWFETSIASHAEREGTWKPCNWCAPEYGCFNGSAPCSKEPAPSPAEGLDLEAWARRICEGTNMSWPYLAEQVSLRSRQAPRGEAAELAKRFYGYAESAQKGAAGDDPKWAEGRATAYRRCARDCEELAHPQSGESDKGRTT